MNTPEMDPTTTMPWAGLTYNELLARTTYCATRTTPVNTNYFRNTHNNEPKTTEIKKHKSELDTLYQHCSSISISAFTLSHAFESEFTD